MLLCLQKMKGLIRKRSTTAARLQRALSKTQRPGAGESPGDPTNSQSPGNRDQGVPLSGQEKRQFLMEAPVQFSTVSGHWVIRVSIPATGSTVHCTPSWRRQSSCISSHLCHWSQGGVCSRQSVMQFYVSGVVVRALEYQNQWCDSGYRFLSWTCTGGFSSYIEGMEHCLRRTCQTSWCNIW